MSSLLRAVRRLEHLMTFDRAEKSLVDSSTYVRLAVTLSTALGIRVSLWDESGHSNHMERVI